MTRTPCLPEKPNRFLVPALCLAAAALLATPSFAQTQVADPNEEAGAGPLCCAVPPPDEVTADHVFGRWVVSTPGIAAKRAGERFEFRRDGTLQTSKGACRYAILRAELTVTCADGSTRTGEVKFIDDNKLIWRLDGKDTVFIAPAD